MKLVRAQIQNFRSAENTEEFSLDKVTCLVGKNEAGKSAVLLAIAALNPHPSTPVELDKERDYPRRYLTNYPTRHPNKDAVAVSTTWQLEEPEIEAVSEEFGPNIFKRTEEGKIEVGVARRYGRNPEWELDLDLSAAFQHLFFRFGLSEVESDPLKAAKNTQELIAALTGMGTPTDAHKALLEELQNYSHVTNRVCQILKEYLPYFMYFSNYDRMDGAIQIEQVNNLTANGQIELEQFRGQKLFAEFLEYSGVPLSEIMSVSTYETFNAKLQSASNNITDQILEYWTQNPDLSVEVRVEQAKSGDAAPFNTGTIARARIHNHLHRVDTPFSERSAGFVWFFSFLVKFAQVKNDANPVVLLLDEPGLTLHGKAQGDLLKFFDEKLAPHHQIIYSTHSPFMVAPNRLMSARIVEDQVEQKGPRRIPLGTKVREDVLQRDPDTLFPLQGALGYEVSQSLFIGKNTLLVEGPGDILYLQALSEALRRKRKPFLDPRWTLCPAGGIDKIRPFVALFGGNHLNIAVLSDHGSGDKRKIEDLRKSEVLKAGHFYTVVDFLDQAEGDIEDLLAPELFVEILNKAYEVPTRKLLTVELLKAADNQTVRQVKQAEAAFRLMPQSVADFDHFAPASWLIRHPEVLEADTEAIKTTLQRAERVFDAFNKLLPR
ncbi:AAA family ATPase [Methylocystis sp.]|uniref:AAA family ATPase n=1 Tax=Methylocystis sp. TaxID=1911079 RepID=UPI003DA3DD25